MDLLRAQAHIDRVCPKSQHEESHVILRIPRRNDVCLAFCEGWDNRLFFVWERNRKIHRKWIGGKDGFQIVPNKNTLVLKGNILKLYCSVLNFIGSGGGASLKYQLGKIGQADPVATE